MNYCNCPNCRTENCPNARWGTEFVTTTEVYRQQAERIAELEGNLASCEQIVSAQKSIVVAAEFSATVSRAKLARYEQTERELPEEPSCLRRGTLYQVTTDILDYIDNLLDYAVAMKEEFAEYKETTNMQMAAISTAAISNSRNSAPALQRNHPYWSAPYNDVVTAVAREIRERERAEEAEAALAACQSASERYISLTDPQIKELSAKLAAETKARNALEGDRAELQAKIGHYEQTARELPLKPFTGGMTDSYGWQTLVEHINKLRDYAVAMKAENDRLEKLVYVPGVFSCAKCRVVLVSTTMHAHTGLMKANTEPQKCPNGCGPLWRRTERDAGNELCDRLEKAEAALAALQKDYDLTTEVDKRVHAQMQIDLEAALVATKIENKDLLAQIDGLTRALDIEIAEREKAEAALALMTKAEHELSSAYLRLRKFLNAFDTPPAPTSDYVWAHTESKLLQLKAQLATASFERRAIVPIAAGQEMTGEGPKKGDTVAPVPAAPDYSSVPMGPVGATYPAAPEPTDHLDAPDSQERAAQTPCTDPACPDEKQYGSVHPAPGPVCDHDSKPCPPPKAGRGPGASQCEQHGVCQRVGFGNSPTLQFELMVPEDTYSNICINCGKSFLSTGKRHVTCPDCLKGESKLLLRAEVCESVRNEIRGAKLWPLSMWANIDELCDQALAAIDLGDELRDMRTIKDAAVRRLSVLGTRIDELENQAKYERQWKEQYYRQSEKLSNDNADLRHDIARHVQICAEQATEIEELKQRAGISILSPIGRT